MAELFNDPLYTDVIVQVSSNLPPISAHGSCGNNSAQDKPNDYGFYVEKAIK
jgi:hypothetical protein